MEKNRPLYFITFKWDSHGSSIQLSQLTIKSFFFVFFLSDVLLLSFPLLFSFSYTPVHLFSSTLMGFTFILSFVSSTPNSFILSLPSFLHPLLSSSLFFFLFFFLYFSFFLFFFSSFYSFCFSPTSGNLPCVNICLPQYFGITKRYMQKKKL